MATIINAWNISSNSYIFENCTTVVNINCNNISWVDNKAINTFANCPNLKKVVGLNNNLTNIHRSFYNCQNLVTVDHLPNNLTVLDSVFEKCISLKDSPAIPESVTTLYSTYSNCYSLQNAPVIPENVTNMKWTFSDCQNIITPPVIPNSVKDMTETFYNAGLTAGANIPNSVTTVESTYQNCTKLVDGGSLPYITNLVRTYKACRNLVDAPVIPNSVTTMTATFEGCTNLSNIPTLPHSVTNLSYTFHGCTNLSNMPAIPNSITTLDHTFKACSSLTNLQSIPLSVRNMAGTFQNCTNLPGSLIILSKDVTNAVDCFNGTSNVRKDVFMPFQYVNNTYTPTYNAFVAAGYSTTDYSKDNTRIHDMDIANVTIYPVPSDANVIFNAPGYTQSGHMITVRKKSDTFPGVPVDWVVNRWGYRNESGSLVPEKDVRIDVTMQKVPFTLTILPHPEDAKVTLTADGYTQEENSISVLYQTSVHWKVEKDGYFTQEGDVVVEQTTYWPVELIRTHYNVTITPLTAGATVTLVCEDAQQTGNSIIAPYMGTVQWSVSKDGYITESGTLNNIMKDIEFPVELVIANKLIFESSTADTYTIVIPEDGYYSVIIVGAGGGAASWGGYYSNGYTWNASGGGGSGGYVHGTLELNTGSYTAIIGKGGDGVRNAGIGAQAVTAGTGGKSSVFGQIAYGGAGGSAGNDGYGGAGGDTSTSLTGETGNVGGSMGYVVAKDYYPIQDISGGASTYGGFGAGGYITNQSLANYNGMSGYIRVALISPKIIIERSEAGTQEITIPVDGRYDIKLVGGGGGGHTDGASVHPYNYGGGSGAYVYGIKTLTAGTYTIVVGAAAAGDTNGGDTSFDGEIAGGGKRSTGGGGVATTTLSYINGNNCKLGNVYPSIGGAPVYENYGRGATANNGGLYGQTAGYIRIEYLGE